MHGHSNDALLLRYTTVSHVPYTVLQERSLDFARDDDTGSSSSHISDTLESTDSIVVRLNQRFPNSPVPRKNARRTADVFIDQSNWRLARGMRASPRLQKSTRSVAPPKPSPAWGRGTAERRSGALINDVLETHSPALFHTASALSAPSGHLPLEGKAIPAQRRSRHLYF